MADRVTVEQHHTPEHTAADEALHRLAFVLNRAALLFVLFSREPVGDPPQTQLRVIGSHLISGVNTLASILRLTDALSLHVKDAVALARVYYETCLVGAFTALDRGERAKRAELYSVYRTFHDQTKFEQVGTVQVKLERRPRMSRQDERVKAALAMFGKGGKGRCFGESREEMLAAVTERDARGGLLLGSVEGMIRLIISEIIHGSLHGHELFHRLKHPGPDQVANLMAHYETVLFSICLSSAGLARVLRLHLAPSDLLAEVEKTAVSAPLPFVSQSTSESLRDVLNV